MGAGRRVAARLVAALAPVLLSGATPVQAVLVGKVTHAGFPASTGDVVRSGAWTPIRVELSLEGEAAFDGFVRVSQPDKDGDLVSDRVPVQLRAESGPRREYVLYCPAAPASGAAPTFSVEVLDTDGVIVEVMSEDRAKAVRSLHTAQSPERLAPDDMLILSVSDDPKGAIGYLETQEQITLYERRPVVAHIQPSDLPDQWIGLEIVDAIVWEKADATALSPAQLTALLAWVRQGGDLLIAASTTSDTLAQNQVLAAVLPVRIGRVVPAETRLPHLRRAMLDAEEDSVYADPLPVVLSEAVAGARVLIAEPALNDAVLAARRHIGRGTVAFVGANLRDLMPSGQGLKPTVLFKKTLELRNDPGGGQDARPIAASLFVFLEQTVGFRRSTGLYLLAAVLFSASYVGIATFGSWAFLRSRGWTRHSWSAFALVAVGAAFLSLLAVQAVRGVEQSVHQLSIVDATAGEVAATATTYFGVKTPTHALLDLWMPADYTQEDSPSQSIGFLKPMPYAGQEGTATAGGYSDPARYQVSPSSAVVEDVPVRATLKQFEGRWAGELRHTLEARVRVRAEQQSSRGDRVLAGSTITNKLGHPLHNCILFQPLTEAYIGDRLQEVTPRDNNILVHSLGRLDDGQALDLAQRIYTAPDGTEVENEELYGRTLAKYQTDWGGKFRMANPLAGGNEDIERFNLEDYQDALLMYTLLGEFNPVNLQTPLSPGGLDFNRRHARQLDRSDELTRDRWLLVGFTEDQGPVMLCSRSGGSTGEYRQQLADRAQTMYRFWIPVQRAGKQGEQANAQ